MKKLINGFILYRLAYENILEQMSPLKFKGIEAECVFYANIKAGCFVRRGIQKRTRFIHPSTGKREKAHLRGRKMFVRRKCNDIFTSENVCAHIKRDRKYNIFLL